MTKSIFYTPNFEKEIKKLSKKYRTINLDFKIILDDLLVKDRLGISIGNNIFKVRMKISDKNKGKSAGARIITFYKRDNVIYLLSIYDKSVSDNITSSKISEILLSLK